MTAIVGLVEEGRIYLGGDSACTTSVIQRQVMPKVFHVGEMLFGYSGPVRMCQILRHAFTPPHHPDGMGVESYLATSLIDAIREIAKDKGNAYKHNEEEYTNGRFLVGYRGRLFDINADYSYLEPEAGYTCIGSGGDVALGAMYATRKMQMEPYARIKLALSAASAYCNGVRGPFVIEEMS